MFKTDRNTMLLNAIRQRFQGEWSSRSSLEGRDQQKGARAVLVNLHMLCNCPVGQILEIIVGPLQLRIIGFTEILRLKEFSQYEFNLYVPVVRSLLLFAKIDRMPSPPVKLFSGS